MKTVVFSGLTVLIVLIFLSVSCGSPYIPPSVVIDSLVRYDSGNMLHLAAFDLRMPRAAASALVGAALAAAGAVMQGTTGNPLADSGLLGLNAGAGFALALCFAFFPETGYMSVIFISFLGAAFGAFFVNSIASMRRGGATPMRLVLAGAAVTAFLAALSQGISLFFNTAQDIMFFTAGGVAAVGWAQVKILAPWTLAALAAAVLLSRSISVMSLGDDVARGLGLNTAAVRLLSSTVVMVLAGSAVAVVGAVGFVGLIFPHLAKFLVGADYRRIIPVSAVLGANMMVLADICARTVNPPAETPIGALAALIGVPFFLYLSGKQKRAV